MAPKKTKKGSMETVQMDNLFTPMKETGCLGFDLAMTNGKGLPMGWSILFYAAPGCGKTTIAAEVSKKLIDSHEEKGEDFKVVFVDVEGSRELLISMGLAGYIGSGKLIIKDGSITFAQLEEIYEKCLAWKDPDYTGKRDEEYKDVGLIIIDSLCQVQSQALMDKAVDDGDFGSNAKERGRFYPKYLPRCKTAGLSSIFITQIRTKQNVTGPYEDPKRPAVTDLDMHNVDIIAKLTKRENSQLADTKKVKIKTVFGEVEQTSRCFVNISTAMAKPTKNRYMRLPDVEVLVEYGKRIINAHTLREMLIGLGYVIQSGGYFTLTEQICEALKIEYIDSKLRRKELNTLVTDNYNLLIDFIKGTGEFRLVLGEVCEEDLNDGF